MGSEGGGKERAGEGKEKGRGRDQRAKGRESKMSGLHREDPVSEGSGKFRIGGRACMVRTWRSGLL